MKIQSKAKKHFKEVRKKFKKITKNEFYGSINKI